MSRNVNKVILVGNLTRNPELRQTQGGQAVATFGLATNRSWKVENGEKQTSAEFHELVAFSRLAEICGEYLKKGMLVYIEGYLKTRSWEGTDGTKKYRTEIVVQDMIRLKDAAHADEMLTDDFVPEEAPTHSDDDFQNLNI